MKNSVHMSLLWSLVQANVTIKSQFALSYMIICCTAKAWMVVHLSFQINIIQSLLQLYMFNFLKTHISIFQSFNGIENYHIRQSRLEFNHNVVYNKSNFEQVIWKIVADISPKLSQHESELDKFLLIYPWVKAHGQNLGLCCLWWSFVQWPTLKLQQSFWHSHIFSMLFHDPLFWWTQV